MDELPIKINIDVDVNELTKPILEPTLNSVGRTISDILEIVFGGVHTFAEKRKFIRENELIAFKNNINKKINSIPINKLKKPDIDVVGPILEASKYYFKNEEIRKLFENLLVSSVNIDYEDCLHHSFCEIIKQLSTDEAILLNFLAKDSSNKNKRFPIVSIRYITYEGIVNDNLNSNGIYLKRFTKENNNLTSELYKIEADYKDFKEGYTLFNAISLDALNAKCKYPQNIQKYLENLKRLGLIDFSNNILINNCDYDNIIKSEFINDMILNNKYFKNSHVMLSHQMNFIFKNHYYKFNEFGCDFIKTCIL